VRPPRLRLTIRSLMIAVALVGLIVFGSITAMRMGSRAKFYQSLALTWKTVESDQRKHLENTSTRPVIPG
jgi:hypothetical protein